MLIGPIIIYFAMKTFEIELKKFSKVGIKNWAQ